MRLATCSCSRRCCRTLMSRSYSGGHSSAPCPIQATSHPRDMSVFGYGGMRLLLGRTSRHNRLRMGLQRTAPRHTILAHPPNWIPFVPHPTARVNARVQAADALEGKACSHVLAAAP